MAEVRPVPSAYAALLWPQEEELATLRARIKNLCMPKGDTSLRVQYEELSWSLRQVENLTVLLPRLRRGRAVQILSSAQLLC